MREEMERIGTVRRLVDGRIVVKAENESKA